MQPLRWEGGAKGACESPAARALNPVALHKSIVEVEHPTAVIAVGLLVAEVDDDQIAVAATDGPRQPVFTCLGSAELRAIFLSARANASFAVGGEGVPEWMPMCGYAVGAYAGEGAQSRSTAAAKCDGTALGAGMANGGAQRPASLTASPPRRGGSRLPPVFT